MSSRQLYTATLALLAVLLGSIAIVASATSTQYGGSVPAPSGVILHSVCGDEAQGLLFAVGTDNTNGLVYRITNLSSFPSSPLINQTPRSIGSQYKKLRFYVCEVVDNYLFVVGETEKGGGQLGGVILVYNITNPDNPQLKAYTETGTGAATQIAYRDVEVKKVDSTYYIYAQSVLVDGATRLDNTSYTAGADTMPGASSFIICSGINCNGYGISLYSDHLGVLYRDTNNRLNLTIFNISAGIPQTNPPPQNVTVVSSFTGVRAAEAAYSGGFLVAAGTKLYRVYLDGGMWKLEEEFTIPDVFAGNAYAMLIVEQGGAIAAYMFTQVDTAINITAVDVVGKSIAYVDSVVDVGLGMDGYGDAYIVWVDDPGSKNIIAPASGYPYMVYTVTDGSSTSYLIYYDLTRGGTVPFPIPEASLLVVVGVVVAAGIAVAVLTRGKY